MILPTSERQPFFSVVIPTYNRARLLSRAIRSVLVQTRSDLEIIVVDDGSVDNTEQVVADFYNEHIIYVRHSANRGVCPARNTGVERANGEWIVFLDSDDELLPGALGLLYQRIQEAPTDIARVSGMYRWDDGSLSPDPKPIGQVLDYEGYIRWSATVHRSDFHNCIRRSTFGRVCLPENHAYETIYHLNFARLFTTWLLPDVIALEHQDARNRTSNLPPIQKSHGLMRDAPDGLWALELLLQDHGETICRITPDRWRFYQRTRILQAFLAGRRRLGWQYATTYLRQFGFSLNVGVATLLGLIGRKPLALVQALR